MHSSSSSSNSSPTPIDSTSVCSLSFLEYWIFRRIYGWNGHESGVVSFPIIAFFRIGVWAIWIIKGCSKSSTFCLQIGRAFFFQMTMSVALITSDYLRRRRVFGILPFEVLLVFLGIGEFSFLKGLPILFELQELAKVLCKRKFFARNATSFSTSSSFKESWASILSGSS